VRYLQMELLDESNNVDDDYDDDSELHKCQRRRKHSRES